MSPTPKYDKRAAGTLKKLRQLARACSAEAFICQQAANLCVTDDDLHGKNAKTWRGRERTCWKAIALICETRENIERSYISSPQNSASESAG